MDFHPAVVKHNNLPASLWPFLKNLWNSAITAK